MATTTKTKPKLTAAAQRKVATKKKDTTPSGKYIGKESGKGLLPPGYKGPEKGKYYGPDKLKGANPTYKAPAKKAPAPAGGTAPVAPTAPVDPGQQSVYDPNAVNSNASGLINLQSTTDLNMQLVNAQTERDQAIAEADFEDQQAEIVKGTQEQELGEKKITDRGGLNTSLAARGMKSGSTGTIKNTEMGTAHSNISTQIAAQRKLANDAAIAKRAGANTNYATKESAINLAKQQYTTDESDTSPTEGSQAEDSGVAPTTIPAPAAPAAPAAPVAKAATKWKGKYRGPDKFKGDEKKLAAWRKAGRPKVK